MLVWFCITLATFCARITTICLYLPKLYLKHYWSHFFPDTVYLVACQCCVCCTLVLYVFFILWQINSLSFHLHVSLCLHRPMDNTHMSCAVSIIIFFICCQCSFTSRYFHSTSATLPLTKLLYSSCLFLLAFPYVRSWLELLTPSFRCIKQHDYY